MCIFENDIYDNIGENTLQCNPQMYEIYIHETKHDNMQISIEQIRKNIHIHI